ncbi:MAG: DUF3467 domain-containing protein [Candidatus Saccharimonadales bacterium]
MSDAVDQPLNVSLDPHKTPVYFADGYLIVSNEQSLVINFTQNLLGASEQSVINRTAMTLEQAKRFLKDLNDHIEKFER